MIVPLASIYNLGTPRQFLLVQGVTRALNVTRTAFTNIRNRRNQAESQFSSDYASSWVQPKQRSIHEKHADSFDSYSCRAAGTVPDNRYGRWWWSSADLLAANKRLPINRVNPEGRC